MKVDIEGAQQVLTEKRIKHIYMEFCMMRPDKVKHRLNRLRKFGYLPDAEDVTTLQKMTLDEKYSMRVQNFLFHAV